MTVSASDSVLSITTCGSTVKADSRAFGFFLVATTSAKRTSPFNSLSMVVALFVVAMLELALELDGVERHAIARGRDLRIDDVGAGPGAGAGHHGQQARV